MVNSLISALSKKIGSIYTDVDIYTEFTNQDLNPPCFHISAINNSIETVVNEMFIYTANLSIKYFPKSDKLNKECNEVGENLFLPLLFLDTDFGAFRGTNYETRVIDGVIVITLMYSGYVACEDIPDELMETLNLNTELNYE